MDSQNGTSTGMISKMFDWIYHPWYSDGDVIDYAIFALLLFLIAMMWRNVIRQTLEAV
jgi:hypothetical protein